MYIIHDVYVYVYIIHDVYVFVYIIHDMYVYVHIIHDVYVYVYIIHYVRRWCVLARALSFGSAKTSALYKKYPLLLSL